MTPMDKKIYTTVKGGQTFTAVAQSQPAAIVKSNILLKPLSYGSKYFNKGLEM